MYRIIKEASGYVNLGYRAERLRIFWVISVFIMKLLFGRGISCVVYGLTDSMYQII